MSEIYDHPRYYEIAFSFRDIPAEVDVLEECFSRFSKIPVKSVLELGCGNSPHMEELVKRCYRYYGLDLSKAMLKYSEQKAAHLGGHVSLFHGNMLEFSLETKVDFVYVMLGSLCATSTSELMTHFNSVANVLKTGGLYLLDWCIQYNPPWESEGSKGWEIVCGDICVKTTVSWKAINRVEQIFEESMILEIDDHGRRLKLSNVDTKRAIYPQEFLLLVSALEHFEFVGWWNNWDLSQPLGHATKISRPITLIRRT